MAEWPFWPRGDFSGLLMAGEEGASMERHCRRCIKLLTDGNNFSGEALYVLDPFFLLYGGRIHL